VSVFDENAFIDLVKEAVRSAVKEELAAAAPPTADEYLPITEAARIAAVAPGTVRAWIDQGKLGRYHAGRVLRIRRRELESLLSSPSETAREPTPEERAFEMFQQRRRKGPRTLE
jgi:excisionase family DNA binding protein